MYKNKQILSYCPNFHKIINFEYFEDDYITSKLIEFYHEYIFDIDINNQEELVKVSELDKVLAKYIDDYAFRKEMKHELLQIKVKASDTNLLDIIVLNIIKIYEKYEEGGSTRIMQVTRWI